ncbi:hypothetical protein LTR10_010181 [Elasticomyces elasticus]|nr:hypothetical protein LTR10_010181 [Elasticomyces elasticus]KAK4972085.1 hypothetical protein LTR42_006591 [Elasticomyces elasticus]
MTALELVGVKPTTIIMCCDALSKDQSWFSLRPHLGSLRRLDLSLLLDKKYGVNVDMVGVNFLLALQQCTVLEELSLSFNNSVEEGDAFDCLASAVLLPQLRRFVCSESDCHTLSMMRFLSNHAATLKSCDLSFIGFWRRDAVEFTDLLNMIRESMRLEQLALYECDEGYSRLRFPDMIKVRSGSEPNDDGYIIVELDETISLKGYDEVQSGLACMLKCMRKD